jgi:septal ring factor EnvC (AmiA/AmiB activator)
MLTRFDLNPYLLKAIILLTLSVMNPAYAAKPNASHLHNKISAEKKKLAEISKDISKFEKKLERTNEEYLKINERKNSLEKELYDLKKKVYKYLTDLSDEKKKVKKILATYIVNMMGKKYEAAELLTQRVLIANLKNELKNYDGQIANTKKVKENLVTIEKSLKSYNEQQTVLLEVISHLEDQKKKKAESYLDSKTKYKDYVAQWQKVKVNKTRTSETGELRSELGTFRPPIERHSKLDFKKKGVTFFFDEKTLPVLAPRSGKVIHKGSLAPYGNVIMIDHGQETISVCFGDFGPKVNKGMNVKEGQIIGYTSKKNRREGKLYFEVRKKDKAQPTIHLLDDKALASTGNFSNKS